MKRTILFAILVLMIIVGEMPSTAHAACSHKWVYTSMGSAQHNQTCSSCKLNNGNSSHSSYNVTAATCSTAKKCGLCGYVVASALGHNYYSVK